MISLFTITTKSNGSISAPKNVLSDDIQTKKALAVAVDAAVAAAGQGSSLAVASQVDGAAVDTIIASAVSPATDGTPKSMFRVSFENGTGANGANVSPVRVIAWPQTSNNVTTSSPTLAIVAALAFVASTAPNAIPNSAFNLGDVDIDARQ